MKKWLLIPILSVLVLLTGCQKTASKPQIMTTFEPMYEFTKAVVGDKVDVAMIVPANQEVHDYEPSAKQVAQMTDASAIVYNSNVLEKWVPSVKTSATKIEAASAVDQIAGDPHTWISPKQSIKEVKYIQEELSKKFPEYKTGFAKNAEAYLTKLEALDGQFDTLKNAKQKTFITQHEAFSYLARDYDLKEIAVTGIDPDIEPSASALANLKKEMEKAGLKSVYVEENANSKIADTLAKSAGADTLLINTVESLSDAQRKAGDDYISLMQENLKSLQKTIK